MDRVVPAGAAVLRDVLVAADGAVVGAVEVTPVVLLGEIFGVHDFLGAGLSETVALDAGSRFLFTGPYFTGALGSDESGNESDNSELHWNKVGIMLNSQH